MQPFLWIKPALARLLFYRSARCWRYVLPCVLGIWLANPALASSGSLISIVSPQLAGGGLLELQNRLGAMECLNGPDGTKDCFIEVPFGAAQNPHRSDKAFVFVRTQGGRVGQLLINGPAAQLSGLIDKLPQYYGAPTVRTAHIGATSAPCVDHAKWQHPGQSVVVRFCRSLAGGHDHFLVNILSDWFAGAQGKYPPSSLAGK